MTDSNRNFIIALVVVYAVGVATGLAINAFRPKPVDDITSIAAQQQKLREDFKRAASEISTTT